MIGQQQNSAYQLIIQQMFNLSLVQRMVCKTLSYANIPKHVAFIMDGNRRYATKLGKKKTEGHQYGFESMRKSLLICEAVGIQIVTLFAFAIENFNRTKEEVDFLMEMVQTKFKQMSAEKGFFEEKQIRVKVIGDRSQLSESVIQCFNEVEEITKNNNRLLVNICFAYNSDYQIEETARKVDKPASLRELMESLMIKECPDIIVRTSNEVRLSNFMTLQSLKSQLVFLEESWPEMNIYSFLRILIPYHINYEEFMKQKALVQQEINSII